MTTQLAPTPVFRGTDAFGLPLYLGQLGTFVAGTNTPQVTYKDSLGIATNTNPVILNPRGECNLWLDPAKAYKLTLSDAAGNLIWTVDNVTIGNANPSYSIIPTIDNLYNLGSATFSWANVYAKTNAFVGPNLIPILDSATGNIGYYARTPAEIAASVTPTAFFYAPGDPRRYGAKGDGVTDDITALTNCHKCNQTINYPGTNFTFAISSAIPITVSKQTINGNGSLISQLSSFVAPGGIAIAMNVASNTTDVTVNQLNFDGSAYSGGTVNNQFLNFSSGCDRARVFGCHFANATDIASNLTGAVAFLQPNKSSLIEECGAENMAGLIFSQGEKTIIANCWTRNCVDVSFVLHSQASIGSSIIGCKVYNEAANPVAAHIQVEEGPSDWIITNNYIKGVRSGLGIGGFSSAVTTVVRGGIIANNVIDGQGLSGANPAGLIGISNFYAGVRIDGNLMMGVPTGNAATCAIKVPALQTRIINNRLDATAGVGNAAAIIINPAGDYCEIFDNWINNTGNGRIVTIGAGNQGNARIYFKGGSFVGGTVGVDTVLNAPTNCPIYFENILESTSTVFYNPSAADSISTYFNTFNAWTKPHSIKQSRFIYGNAIPTNGAWNQGDTVYNNAPVSAGFIGWVCTAGGSPGTWKTFGLIS